MSHEGSLGDTGSAEAVPKMVCPPENWTFRIQTIPTWVSVLCNTFLLLNVSYIYACTSMVGWRLSKWLLWSYGSFYPIQSHLTVRRVLSIKKKPPQPLHKDLRRLSGVFYNDLQHSHRLLCIHGLFIHSPTLISHGNTMVCTFSQQTMRFSAAHVSTAVTSPVVIRIHMCFVALETVLQCFWFSPFFKFCRHIGKELALPPPFIPACAS